MVKSIFSHLLWVLVLSLLLSAGCSSSRYSEQQTGLFRSPEYYQTFGPGAMQPPDYGTPQW